MSSTQPTQTSPVTTYLRDYTPPAFLIDTAELTFRLREKGTTVESKLSLRRNPLANTTDSLRLDGEELKPVWFRINGEPVAEDLYAIDDESFTLFSSPDAFVLESEVEIRPEENTALEGLYRSATMFCTQCEAEGFRKITWFLDRPDVMTKFTVRVEADKKSYPVLLSNGNPGDSGALPDGMHFAVWEDPIPKPCYLFALVAGDLQYIQDWHTTPSGKKIDLRIYVEPQNIDKCSHAMESLIKSMVWDETEYGREYDLDVFNIVAVGDFNMGAMENKGLNIFNSKFVLAKPDTATDVDFQGIEAVIGHEYFHNWTGNRITCRDWFQLSLKEGLTVFRDQEFSADMGDRQVKRIEDVRLLRSRQFAEDASPMAHPIRPTSYIEINNFYTLTVYEKGAEVVRMLQTLLGPDKYRQATDLYFERHDGQAVTTEDFVACMADIAGRDLQQFQRWYDWAGTPQLQASGEYNQQKQEYSLTIVQSIPDTPGQTDKPPLHIPVAVGLLGPDGKDMLVSVDDNTPSSTNVLELTDSRQTFVFSNVVSPPVPSLLRGFSAPVKMNFDYTREEFQFLMEHDSDGFHRWDAAQTFATQVILDLIPKTEPVKGGIVNISTADNFVSAFRSAMLDSNTSPALTAEILSLPSIGYLGDSMPVVDIDGLFVARKSLRQALCEGLQEDLLQQYHARTGDAAYTITPQAIGKRRLRNTVLSYLMVKPTKEAFLLCEKQYEAQHNMTDVIAALSLLADSEHPRRQEFLDHFCDKWKDDPLVMDKWFAIQATSTRIDTLAQVRTLLSHPNFAIKNPNKVRSLIGAFASGNPVRFHAISGEGYNFVAEQVVTIDGLNPQIAARLLRVFSRWQRYDKGRQILMRNAIEKVLASKPSKDTYEVASKSLAA